MEPWSIEWKQQQIDQLRTKWMDCQACGLGQLRKNVVFGEGNPNADIMFIGEAPGANEDKIGQPFVGDAGAIFIPMLEYLGIRREDTFITNIVACRPPNNRDPISAEKEACMPRVYELIYLVDPLLIVAVGKFALNALVGGRSWGIEKEHGHVFSSPDPQIRVPGERNGCAIPGRVFPRRGADKKEYTLEYDVVPIFHPAYIMRMDSQDPKTGEYPKGGPADHTVRDLKAAIERVAQLKTEYASIRRTIEKDIIQ
jgi:uracil-DNA glycosylase family 4